jgi:hypothetical protein
MLDDLVDDKNDDETMSCGGVYPLCVCDDGVIVARTAEAKHQRSFPNAN